MKFFKSKFFIIILFLFFIRLIYSIYLYNFKYNDFIQKECRLTICEKYKETEKSTCYIAKYGFDKVLVYVKKESDALGIGDVIFGLCKKLESEYLENYNEFNYERYLKSNGICLRLYLNEFTIVSKCENGYSYTSDFKEFLNEKFGNLSGLISSIILR